MRSSKNSYCRRAGYHREYYRRNREQILERKKYKKPLYSVWNTAMTACYNPKSKDYPNYGGRGITVCEEWRNDYYAFEEYILTHLGAKPSPGTV